jgi:hypothetical protein
LLLPRWKEHVDREGPARLNTHTIEIRDGVSANIHPIQHTGTGKRSIRIVVGKMARSLPLNNQESKFSDFMGEFGNVSGVGTLPPQPPVLQGPIGLSPSGFTARTFGTAHKQIGSTSSQTVKQGVVARTDCTVQVCSPRPATPVRNRSRSQTLGHIEQVLGRHYQSS